MREETVAFDPLTWREDYDWKEAFTYAQTTKTATNCAKEGFAIDDVAEVLKTSPGENDGDSWLMVGRLKDGRFFFLDAWCDYTGWDCQAGGDAQVADTLDNLIRYGMDERGRDRLSYTLE